MGRATSDGAAHVTSCGTWGYIPHSGLIAGQCKPFVSIPWYFVIMGSNKSEYVISSLSVPWISGVSIHFRIWLQFHNPDEIYLLTFPGYIYTGHGCGSKNNLLHLKPFVSLVQFLLSHSFPVTEKSAGHLLGMRLFPFSSIILSMGRCDSVYDDLQSKEALVGWSLVNVNLSYPSHDIL